MQNSLSKASKCSLCNMSFTAKKVFGSLRSVFCFHNQTKFLYMMEDIRILFVYNAKLFFVAFLDISFVSFILKFSLQIEHRNECLYWKQYQFIKKYCITINAFEKSFLEEVHLFKESLSKYSFSTCNMYFSVRKWPNNVLLHWKGLMVYKFRTLRSLNFQNLKTRYIHT